MKTMRNFKLLFPFFCKNMKRNFVNMMKKKTFRFKNQLMRNLIKNQQIFIMFWYAFQIKTLKISLWEQKNHKSRNKR